MLELVVNCMCVGGEIMMGVMFVVSVLVIMCLRFVCIVVLVMFLLL